MDEIRNVIASVLQIPPEGISDNLAMDDCDSWDSLKHMELIAAIEQHLGCELSFEEIITMRSLDTIENVVVNRRNGG